MRCSVVRKGRRSGEVSQCVREGGHAYDHFFTRSGEPDDLTELREEPMTTSGQYPEHDKLKALEGLNAHIGQFVEWMQNEQGWALCQWVGAGNNGEPRYLWRDPEDGPGGAEARCYAKGFSIKYRSAMCGIARRDHKPDRFVFRETVRYHEFVEPPEHPKHDHSASVANPDYESWGSGFVPVHLSIEKILSMYFEIDTKKLEQEKQAMLDSIRKTARVASAGTAS